jgi:hypothetical protein
VKRKRKKDSKDRREGNEVEQTNVVCEEKEKERQVKEMSNCTQQKKTTKNNHALCEENTMTTLSAQGE